MRANINNPNTRGANMYGDMEQVNKDLNELRETLYDINQNRHASCNDCLTDASALLRIAESKIDEYIRYAEPIYQREEDTQQGEDE